MDDEKAKAIGQFLGNIFGLVIAFFIAVWFTIDAGYEYGWFAGGFHGAWVPFNWLRSLFDSAIHMKAPHTHFRIYRMVVDWHDYQPGIYV